MVLETVLEDTLVKNDGTEIKTQDLSAKAGSVIGLYFSAHWCPPCRGFTPKLCDIYNEIKKEEKDFEIVFISWDSSEPEFKSYHGDMPWLALPYDKRDLSSSLGEKYGVDGIPALILLDGATGETITKEGRDAVTTHGAAGFPFSEERLAECRKESLDKIGTGMKEMDWPSMVSPLFTLGSDDELIEATKQAGELASSYEAVAIAFFEGSDCQGSTFVCSKLGELKKSLGERLGVFIVPMEDISKFSDKQKENLVGCYMMKFGDQSKNVVDEFTKLLSTVTSPHVVVFKANEDSSITVYSKEAARDIYFVGEDGFPWSKEALDAIKEKEIALKAEAKAKLKDFEIFESSESCHVIDKSGNQVNRGDLQANDVVGIYFSAHWCGPCRFFTPKLTEVYNKCKEQGKKFEVVFASSDRSQEEFDDYYAGMPWCALSFKDRKLKETLSDVFEVEGIPTLVLMKGNGEIITKDGREAIGHGDKCFPWSEEDIKKVKEEEERLAKEKAEKDAALKAEAKAKLKNFEIFETSEICHVVDKLGNQINSADLQAKDVVGLYFSAHWCGPCREFTPKLADVYNKCKEQGKSFEIVFLSSDRSQKDFDEYYAEMPWCTLSYGDRELKGTLSDIFEIRGIPALILLGKDGEVFSKEGREAVSYGDQFFPWGEEDMKKGKEEAERKKNEELKERKDAEKKVYALQEEANKIVVRRHRGSLGEANVTVDYEVKFKQFSTVAAPSAVVPAGKKAFYEVTFKEGDGVSQIGWATSGFDACDKFSGDGVGDCDKSYGFDGQRKCKWFNGSTSWGKQFDSNGDKVLGVAIDMENGKLMFGLDGDWSDPMGLAFEGIDKDLGLYPALTGSEMTIFINFGYSDFKYGPPDSTFEKMKDIV